MYNFITFRTHDSIDEYVRKLNSQNLSTKIKQYNIDNYLDNSTNGAYLNGEIVDIIKDLLFKFDKEYYELIAFAIMPNHIHIVILPKEKLSVIMKMLKGNSSIQINKILNKKGVFWAREYYDKVIRDEKQFYNTIEYVLNNPFKANLEDSKNRIYSNTDIIIP
jgi:REP element-mobilizing transposase RayT